MTDTTIIVGGGQTGGDLATALRQLGYEGRIVLVGEEPVPPYRRPPLSKAYLSGEVEEEALLIRPRATYEKQNIELRTGRRLPGGSAAKAMGTSPWPRSASSLPRFSASDVCWFPSRRSGRSSWRRLLMELINDGQGNVAPRLSDVFLSTEQALAHHAIMMHNVMRKLCAGLVHGDLSEFNVLVDEQGPVIIDLPQAVDAAANNHAEWMLERDVNRITSLLRQVCP